MSPHRRQTQDVLGQLCDQLEYSVLSKKFSSSQEICLVLSTRGNSWNRTDVHLRNFCTPAAAARPQQIPLNGWARDTVKESVETWSLVKRKHGVRLGTQSKHNGWGDCWPGKRRESQADRQRYWLPSSRSRLPQACSSVSGHVAPVVCQTRRPRMRARECVRPGLTPSASSTKKSKQQSKWKLGTHSERP